MKKFSHSIITKIIVFSAAVLCMLGIIQALVEVEMANHGYFSSLTEEHFFESQAYLNENENVLWTLALLLGKYKNEDYILSGATISEEEWRIEEQNLFEQFRENSPKYNHRLNQEENYAIFLEEYKEEISKERENLIKKDLRRFQRLLHELQSYEEPFFYATDGSNVFTNTKLERKEHFATQPAYMIFEGFKQESYPEETALGENFLYSMVYDIEGFELENTVIYLSYSKQYLDQKITEWEMGKEVAKQSLVKIGGFTTGFILSFIYLVIVIGRKSIKDEFIHFHGPEEIYVDIQLILATIVIVIYGASIDSIFDNILKIIVPVMVPIVIIGLLLLLSLVKHIKNKTIFKHTFIYMVINKLVQFIGEVYRSGGTGVKTVLIVIGYPILIALTFFMFPITIGVAAWFAFKKVKSFQAIQEGVETIKAGNLQHRIEAAGKGDFARLAENINTITDGLKNAVANELKSERLKTELITNVSHDIRTPLTSIITYVDLLKNEQNPEKIKDYVEVLDQKAKRLKTLTDDLFEASKASSGNIPVQLEKIDIASLLNQGLGEVSDKIEAANLDFKVKIPDEKIYLQADGRLLWRSIENLLSNIFKYALEGSRVYISVEDSGNECVLTFKNISAYELNISPDELMERFKRGDESRSSQGSGLGLSIAKSLIELQNGRFNVEIDGDLFKAVIYLKKYNVE